MAVTHDGPAPDRKSCFGARALTASGIGGRAPIDSLICNPVHGPFAGMGVRASEVMTEFMSQDVNAPGIGGSNSIGVIDIAKSIAVVRIANHI